MLYLSLPKSNKNCVYSVIGRGTVSSKCWSTEEIHPNQLFKMATVRSTADLAQTVPG